MITHKNQNSYQRVLDYLAPILVESLHVKRIESGLNLDVIFPVLVPHLVGVRKEIVVALDWTDFSKDKQATLALHLVTKVGRTSAMLWKTILKSKLKDNQNNIEDELISKLKDFLPDDVQVTLLSDRGFTDTAFFTFLRQINFDFVSRTRNNILVTHKTEKKQAKSWLFPTGKARLLKGVQVTEAGYFVPSFVSVHDKKMDDAWYLFSSLESTTASEIVKLYGRRFTIEECFRDIKDNRYGMGLSSLRVSQPVRRDRMLLICALAFPLLTLLGAAGEQLGMDRMLKVNTVKRRTHSLLNQGCYYFAQIADMKKEKPEGLLNKFNELLLEQRQLTEALGWV